MTHIMACSSYAWQAINSYSSHILKAFIVNAGLTLFIDRNTGSTPTFPKYQIVLTSMAFYYASLASLWQHGNCLVRWQYKWLVMFWSSWCLVSCMTWSSLLWVYMMTKIYNYVMTMMMMMLYPNVVNEKMELTLLKCFEKKIHTI